MKIIAVDGPCTESRISNILLVGGLVEQRGEAVFREIMADGNNRKNSFHL